jgi:hypothetical protein
VSFCLYAPSSQGNPLFSNIIEEGVFRVTGMKKIEKEVELAVSTEL